MKKALIAIDPSEMPEENLESLSGIITHFQSRGFFSELSIVSVIHPDMYLTPLQWFKEMKPTLVKQAVEQIAGKLGNRFHFTSIKILSSESDGLESLTRVVTRYGKRTGHRLLVVASHNRKGLPHWFLGSFSETAALTAALPILVVKPDLALEEFSPEPLIVIGVDPAVPLPASTLRWIADCCRGTAARIDLIYVKPRPRPLWDKLQPPRQGKDPLLMLQNLVTKLNKAGVHATALQKDETTSVAQTLVDHAEQERAWVIMTLNDQRITLRKLLLGSTSRRTLCLTRRPFLSLRLD
ncbi:universal stress protein [Oligoflexus tunisiensis]|uniref:universal stress protein n=1 Tax=Oligoflexus tunisiensis TaxID=708132 RepID=UPI00114CB4FF|nr:universal stress protein [Oligoflexus tunisiensis]